MRATIIDIAKIAGVSRTTVSNIVNGNFKCSTETKEKVLKLIDDLDYTPNTAARTLVENKSYLIGLVLPFYIDKNSLTKTPFYNLIIDAINTALREETNYDLIINCVTQKNNPKEVRNWVMKRSIDGLIFVGDYNKAILEELDAKGLPMVLIDNYCHTLNNAIFVNIDDEEGAYIAARHLVVKGYKKVAICTSTIGGSSVNDKRYKGYKRALTESGLQEFILKSESIFFESGMKMAEEAIEKGVDAVFAVSDMLALGILKKLLLSGKKVPEEIGIVGFDNLEISGQYTPALSTIDQDVFGKGKIAVELLLDAIKNGPKKKSVLMPVNLVHRETTDRKGGF